MDSVNIIIYPIQYSRKVYADHWKPGQTSIVSTKGRIVDHVAFSVDDLPATLERLRAAGVRITAPPASIPGTTTRSAFVEGPNSIRLELVEGHAKKQ